MLLNGIGQEEQAVELRRRKNREDRFRMQSARHTLERLSGELLEAFLDPREEKVLRLRLGLEDGRTYTCAEIGMELDVSLERVRQIQNVAIRRLTGRRRR